MEGPFHESRLRRVSSACHPTRGAPRPRPWDVAAPGGMGADATSVVVIETRDERDAKRAMDRSRVDNALAVTRDARDASETTSETSSDARDPDAASRAFDAVVGGVREILHALGEDVEREGLRDTPKRVAKALAFAMRGYDACPTAALGTALFHERGMERASCATTVEDVRCGTSDVVLVRDIPVFSTCAKTFMPFYGVIHVGYVPRAGVIVGLSKLARVAEVYARRLQTPNGLAYAVARALDDVASPHGVGVMFTGVQLGPFEPQPLEGRASAGCFAEDKSVWWDEFSALIELGGGPSDLSRGIWGDASPCGSCDAVQGGATARGDAEKTVLAAAATAAVAVSQGVVSSVANLLRTLDLERRVPEATGGEFSLEDTAMQYARLLSAMRSGSDVPFEAIANFAARDVGTSAECAVEDICIMRDLHMSTVCEHHLLPFHGTVNVAYALGPGARALSRDTVQALVSRHSRRLQVQERLTRDIAEEISTLTGGVGVIVAARAAHLCMVSRGVEKPGSSTCTATKLGRFAREPALRARVWKHLSA